MNLTGPKADNASKYLMKRGLDRGSTSTLRKLWRAQRIAAGERPLTLKNRPIYRAFVVGVADGKALVRVVTGRVHPTKGFRDLKVVERIVDVAKLADLKLAA